MDKQTLIEMLKSIRKDGMLGPTGTHNDIIDHIDFALDHKLVTRTNEGNFEITGKGVGLLEEKLSWDDV
jgi:hypothetical protein